MTPRNLSLLALVFGVALFRLLPHPPNFSPAGAMALFAGAAFADRRLAFLAPLSAMTLSDLWLGFSAMTPWVYACIAATAAIGLRVGSKPGFGPVVAGSLAGSALFFLVTNAAVWAFAGYYPRTAEGLWLCYVAAIPFFQNSLLGDLVFAACIFGGLRIAEHRFTWMRACATSAVPCAPR